MKYFFEVFGPNNIASKIGSLSLTVFCTGPCEKISSFKFFVANFARIRGRGQRGQPYEPAGQAEKLVSL